MRTTTQEHTDLPEEAVRRLTEVVGADAVLLTDAERDTYRDPYWFQGDRTYDSSAVVFPTSTDQVREVVRIANAYRIPVWTSSQGRNNGYGGPSPRVRGSLLISFRRMNRVLEINRELAYAVVEPGVRWFDLYDALEASGNGDLWCSIPDLGWGASSATPWTTGSPTARTARTSRSSAGWRSSSPTGNCCAPAWEPSPATRPGTSTSGASALSSTRCSSSPTTAS